MTICTYSERTDQQHCMYNLIKVKFKFLGDKKDQQKVLSWSLKNWLSIFYKACLSNSQKCVYFWSLTCEGMDFYVHCMGPHIKKEYDVE